MKYKIITRKIRKGGAVKYNNQWFKPFERFLPYDSSLDGHKRQFHVIREERGEDVLTLDQADYNIVEKHVSLPYGFSTIPITFHIRRQWIVDK